MTTDLLQHDHGERTQFERLAYQRYIFQRSNRTIPDDATDVLSQDELMWRQPDGTYGVLNMNAAWWGWQARAVVDLINQLNSAGE